MPETIATKFDPSALPEWAQRHSEVVWLARRDVAFRCGVYTAETEPIRRRLTEQAKEVYYGPDKRYWPQ